jgi:hypothetical protein
MLKARPTPSMLQWGRAEFSAESPRLYLPATQDRTAASASGFCFSSNSCDGNEVKT